MMESDKYTENDILNFKYYTTVLDVNKIIESDFIDFINNLKLNEEEKQTLTRLFYKYGVAGYAMRDKE